MVPTLPSSAPVRTDDPRAAALSARVRTTWDRLSHRGSPRELVELRPTGPSPAEPDRSELPTAGRRFLIGLGMPALALTFAVTVATAYLPVLVGSFGGPLAAALLVSFEGLFSMLVPPLLGPVSDRSCRTVGDRLRWLTYAGAATALALLAVGWVATFATSVSAVLLILAVFYVAYYAALVPYWALFPDSVPGSDSARSRAAEGTWRVIGSAAALVLGGFLLAIGEPVPFTVGAVAVVACIVVARTVLADRVRFPVKHVTDDASPTPGASRALLREAPVRRAMVCVALWAATLGGIRAFVVLFFVTGLDYDVAFVSGVVFPVAAIGFVLAPFGGKLADRFGLRRLLLVGSALYGAGLIIPGFTQNSFVLLLVPVVAAGAAVVQTMDFALMMRVCADTGLSGDDNNGAASGLYGLARGIGTFGGPLLGGVAVVLTSSNIAEGTAGYQAVWPVLGALTLLSLLALRGLGAMPRQEQGAHA